MERKTFINKTIMIGIPVILSNLVSIGLNLIDTLMIGMIGEDALAAVGAANQVYFIFIVALFGLFSGAAVYTAQYWGAQDIKGLRRVLGIDYGVCTIVSFLFTIVAFVFAPLIIGFFSKDERVIGYGVDYIRIVCISYVFTGISHSISYNSRAVQKLAFPTAVQIAALLLNAALNYILIFGKLGLPAMGVKGAALATLIARILECLVLLLYIYSKKDHPLKAALGELKLTSNLFKEVMKKAIPVILTEASWAITTAIVFAAYGKLGTAALAVTQVANVFAEIMQTVFFGIGNTTAVIIGESLGQKNKERAYHYGQLALYSTVLFSAITTTLLVILAKPIMGIYDFQPETSDLLVRTLRMQAYLILPKMLTYMYIVGILRAGGDTFYCMVLEVICNWLVTVPLAFFAVLVLKTTLPIALLIVSSSEVVRLIACAPRFRSRKWMNIVTE